MRDSIWSLVYYLPFFFTFIKIHPHTQNRKSWTKDKIDFQQLLVDLSVDFPLPDIITRTKENKNNELCSSRLSFYCCGHFALLFNKNMDCILSFFYRFIDVTVLVRPVFTVHYSQSPRYRHPLNTDSFVCPWGKPLSFSLNLPRLIRVSVNADVLANQQILKESQPR